MKQSKKVCPRCGNAYKGYPALSRVDNKTEICPKCGIDEAMEDYYISLIRKEGKDVTYKV